jgi:hypothetical protein
MLSDEEIVRRLREIRLSPRRERYARRAPSMNALAVETGITREHIHKLTSGTKGLGPLSRIRLSAAFEKLVILSGGSEPKPSPAETRVFGTWTVI